MDFYSFLAPLATSKIAPLAAVFLGIMMAVSPCPLASNITAVAYVSSKSKRPVFAAALYSLGRAFTYVALASFFVYLGVQVQPIALFLQKYGELFLGPILLLVAAVLLELIDLDFGTKSDLLKKVPVGNCFGSFLFGAALALAFCPFSGVIFFGMLLPLSIAANDGILIPALFGVATALPVLLFAIVLSKGKALLFSSLEKTKDAEAIVRKIAGVVIGLIGIYYSIRALL